MKKFLILFCFIAAVGFFLTASARCAEKKDGGPIIFTKPVRGVVFFHKDHRDLDCSDCHPDIFKMKKGTAEKGDFTMKSMEKGETCGACHDGDTAFSVKSNCTRCHIGVTGVKRLLHQLNKK